MQELRSAVRFPIQLPVAILADKSIRHDAVTSDISAGGVLFHVETDLAVGSEIDFHIVLPASVLGTPNDVNVNCNGRVVRSSVISGRRTIAAVIDEYCFERR